MNTIQQIFQDHANGYLSHSKLPLVKMQAVQSISSCRTAKLGGHVDECMACGTKKISYNSCRNRNCPICQNIRKEQWIDSRKSELINTHYFHVVFTLPNTLNPLIYANQKLLYDLLFLCVKETLLSLGADPKYLGAQIGAIAVLHTWGQNLSFHPHVHCIVPGGGLSFSGDKFIPAKKKFFIPVRVMSKIFRGKFLFYLQRFFKNNNLIIPVHTDFGVLLDCLYTTKWVVYCKKPFKDPFHVISYLARYTHKVAITNSRIQDYSTPAKTVTFKYKDYKDKNQNKLMTLSASEFIRRFMLHVLPEKFFKIRYFGILSPRNRKTKLHKCQTLTRTGFSSLKKRTTQEILLDLYGSKFFECTHCSSTFISRYKLQSVCLLE